MPERSLLEILARTAYWIEWWRRFGPPSGSDPKLAKPLLRYVLTTFSYGIPDRGAHRTARSIRPPSRAARHHRPGGITPRCPLTRASDSVRTTSTRPVIAQEIPGTRTSA